LWIFDEFVLYSINTVRYSKLRHPLITTMGYKIYISSLCNYTTYGTNFIQFNLKYKSQIKVWLVVFNMLRYMYTTTQFQMMAYNCLYENFWYLEQTRVTFSSYSPWFKMGKCLYCYILFFSNFVSHP
jgi:hypothetical protein